MAIYVLLNLMTDGIDVYRVASVLGYDCAAHVLRHLSFNALHIKARFAQLLPVTNCWSGLRHDHSADQVSMGILRQSNCCNN